MTNIRAVDMLFLDDLFGMRGGYVLDFSNKTFRYFFDDELGVDIDNPLYAKEGGSKGKRLRCFLQTADEATAARALKALWEYREAIHQRSELPDSVNNSTERFQALVQRLEGNEGLEIASRQQKSKAFSRPKPHELASELIALSALQPQARGYAFEKFLKKLFDCYGLAARDSFRIRGEQIDGSFQLSGETYLVEAKWQNMQTGADELRAFHGKIEEKVAWTRGLFISNSGFTNDGLVAFGRGKRVICMDGFDLSETLQRGLPLNEVLVAKARRAAETGLLFVRVRDIFPG